MYFQDMIDNEQNKIRNTAKSLSNRELITFLIEDGLILGHPYILTREELIDRYCEIVYDRNHL